MLSLFPSQQNKIPLLALIIIHLTFAVSIIFAYLNCDRELQKEAHAQEIVASTTILSKLYYDAGLAIGAYSLTKNDMFADRYQKLIGQIPTAIETLHVLTDQQPVKEIKFQEIEQVAKQALTQLISAKAVIDSNASSPFTGNQGEVRALYKKIKLVTDQLQDKLDQLSQGEQKLAKDSPHHRKIFQLLLATSFILYVSYNLAVQQRLSNLVCRLAHHTTSVN
jgi:CHASE3 domain sensor protein